MKKTIIALAMAFALTAQAEESQYQHCESMSNLSYSIMKAHQKGVAMSTMMNKIGDTDMTRIIIRMAYDEPRYSTPEMQNRAQGKFRDYIYGLCVDEFSEE